MKTATIITSVNLGKRKFFIRKISQKCFFTFYDVVSHSDKAVLHHVKTTVDKLKPLRHELKLLMKEVEDGQLDKRQAADKIIEIRMKMDEVINHLKNSLK